MIASLSFFIKQSKLKRNFAATFRSYLALKQTTSLTETYKDPKSKLPNNERYLNLLRWKLRNELKPFQAKIEAEFLITSFSHVQQTRKTVAFKGVWIESERIKADGNVK